MIKKLLLGILGATVALALLAGCGGESPAGEADHPKPEIDETPLSEFSVAYDANLQGAVIKKYTGSSLKVRIPDEVEGEPVVKIGEKAFEESGVMYVYLPDTVKVIDLYAFKDCTGIADIDLPESVIEIGNNAFKGCAGLTSIKIPSGVTELGPGTFDDCGSLVSVELSPNMTRAIGFRDCPQLTHIDIPDSVTEIVGFGRSGVTELVIPGNVKNIGTYSEDGTFCKCETLTSVKLLEGVTSIGNCCFRDCPKLTDVQIPDSVTSIGPHAFRGCDNLNKETIDRILEIDPSHNFEL